MQISKISSDYAAEISTDDMLALLAFENAFNGGTKNGEDLFQKLERLPGVDSVDYDGHFGACIYFGIETEHDTPDTHAAIAAEIEAHLTLARAFQKS